MPKKNEETLIFWHFEQIFNICVMQCSALQLDFMHPKLQGDYDSLPAGTREAIVSPLVLVLVLVVQKHYVYILHLAVHTV